MPIGNGKSREGSFFKKLLNSKPKEVINKEKDQNKEKGATKGVENDIIHLFNQNQAKLPKGKDDSKNPTGLKGGGPKSKSKRKPESQTSKSQAASSENEASGSAGSIVEETEVVKYEEKEVSSASKKSDSRPRNSKDLSKSTYYTYGSYYSDNPSKSSGYKTSSEGEEKKPPEDNDMCKNGKPYMAIGSEEGKGIFFKIPGKVTHKTTIRIASFPGCCPPPCCCTGGDSKNIVEEGKELEIEELIPSDIAARCIMPALTPGPCPSPCCPPNSMQLIPNKCNKICEKETFLNNCNINYGPAPGVSPFAGGFGSFSQHMTTRGVMANSSTSTCGSPQPRNYNYNYYLPGYQQQQQPQPSYYPQNCYNNPYYR